MRLYGIVVIERLKNIRLVVSDIDGTLLTSDNHLHPTTMGAVHFFEKNPACKFTFSTGRAFPRIQPMADLFNLQIPFIFSGGAIFDPQQGEILYAEAIDKYLVEKVSNIANAVHVGLIAHTTGKMFCQLNDHDWKTIASLEWLKGRSTDHAKRVFNLSEEVESPIIRLDIFSEDGDLVPIHHALSSEIDELFIVPMKRSIEITPRGVDKGSALQHLAAILQISPQQVMAIGDSLNDMRLLDMAGVSVAMGTAPDVLKSKADIVVPSSDEGGFAHVLDFLAWTGGI